MGLQTNKAATTSRTIYRTRKALGLCTACGKTPPGPKSKNRCEPCRIKTNKNNAKRRMKIYTAHTRLGICGMCLSREAMPNRKWCGVCSEAHTEAQNAKRIKWAKEGLCKRCGGVMPCEKCRAKYRAKNAIMRKSARFKQRCASCGGRGSSSHRVCDRCRAASSERGRELRRFRATNGLCTKCGAKNKGKFKLCSPCRKAAAEDNRKRYGRNNGTVGPE